MLIEKRRIFSVFLSSTGSDLDGERQAIYEALNRMQDCKCVRMEDFAAQPVPADVVCKNEVQLSDIFVGLVAFRHGALIDPGDMTSPSYTELEYDSALEAKLPILMHIAPDTFKEPHHARQNDEFLDKQLAFRDRIQAMPCTPEAWRDKELLAMFVVLAVRQQIDHLKGIKTPPQSAP
ncbi:DUF4062 domain-containing protein [Candidatus Rhodobacter oscarellae]|uniref:DUF4062 domain-containing protein n=1 Tax=Candidatus Rhodobacter oscarellae TaxID=1675527 RepID=UPI0009E513A5|nr:DUF4062 domain-containing protein [Candidatus Rhodobacter lobularis]